MCFFEPSALGREGHPLSLFLLQRGMKRDAFDAVVMKEFVTSVLLCVYDVITCIFADV